MTTISSDVKRYIVHKDQTWDESSEELPVLKNEQIMVLATDYDALAAHVERLKPIAQYGLRAARNRNCPDSLEWTNILADAPTTSLARQKLLWQAEALEAFGNGWDWERQPNHKDVRQYAEKLRRQAEGGVR